MVCHRCSGATEVLDFEGSRQAERAIMIACPECKGKGFVESEVEQLKTENFKLRMLLMKVLDNFTFDPLTRCYKVSQLTWFNQPYQMKEPARWLKDELANIEGPK